MALILPQLKDFVYTPLEKVSQAKLLLFWSQMKDMTKIRLFYSGSMAITEASDECYLKQNQTKDLLHK